MRAPGCGHGRVNRYSTASPAAHSIHCSAHLLLPPLLSLVRTCAGALCLLHVLLRRFPHLCPHRQVRAAGPCCPPPSPPCCPLSCSCAVPSAMPTVVAECPHTVASCAESPRTRTTPTLTSLAHTIACAPGLPPHGQVPLSHCALAQCTPRTRDDCSHLLLRCAMPFGASVVA